MVAAEQYEAGEGMALVPYAAQGAAMGLVRPLVDAPAAKAAIREYEALKAAIVQDSDIQVIQDRKFLKKAFWRRVATCFGLSLDLVSEARDWDEAGTLSYSVVYRAMAPNGRSMIGDGFCSTAEAGRGGWPEHNVRATAHTRAKNRAISDLVGGGEVSAEEMPEDGPTPPRRPVTRAAPKPGAVPTMASLRKRMLALGVKSMGDADRFAEAACRKPTWEALTEADALHLERYIVAKEAEKKAAEAKLAAASGQGRREGEPVEGDAPDLRDLDTGAPGN